MIFPAGKPCMIILTAEVRMAVGKISIILWLKRYGLKPAEKPVLQLIAWIHKASKLLLVVTTAGATIWESR